LAEIRTQDIGSNNLARPSSDKRRLVQREVALVSSIRSAKKELEEIEISKRVLRRLPDDGEDGPVFEINRPEGTFKLEIVNCKLVTSGSLEPTEAASIFFEDVGRHVIDYLRQRSN
jgi:hypothetical protein